MLSPSRCLVGIGDPPSRFLQHFRYKPQEWRSLCGGGGACVCNMVWGGGRIYDKRLHFVTLQKNIRELLLNNAGKYLPLIWVGWGGGGD